jgi:glycosyltransferase involved in cell wall biosynthesis
MILAGCGRFRAEFRKPRRDRPEGMRIGLSTSVMQRGRSGVGQYVLALTRALIPHATQHQFFLFALREDVHHFDFARNIMEIVPVAEEKRSPVRDILWHQRELPRLARELNLDVLHVPSYRRLVWSRPCRMVGTVHDLAPFRLANKYDWKRMLYGRVVAKRLAARQHKLIAVSNATARDLERFFRVPRERITVVYNGIDHDRFRPASADTSRGFVAGRFGLRKPFFLYVARLEHPAKNHVRLISAFERFKAETRSDWQLAFGGADWHGAEAIHAAARASSCAADIHSLGFVEDSELPDLYRAASVFVYPSLFEGFGLPPIEAMACGCPVICSARGSLSEVVDNAAQIIDPENPADIAGSMIHLFVSDEARRQARDAGFRRARQFDWNLTAEATLEAYTPALKPVDAIAP